MKEKAKLHKIILDSRGSKWHTVPLEEFGCKTAGVFFVDRFLLDKILNQEGPKNKWFNLYMVG